jgi:CRP/FNR family cyclic AMP-dependent transcriptional regulator
MVAGPSSLLDVDPEFGREIDADTRALAREALEVELLDLPSGPLVAAGRTPAGWGSLLIVNGLLTREVRLATGRSIEPLGPGDLLRPWQEDAASFVDAEITVLTPATVAVLDREFVNRACRFPGVVEALIERAVRRSRLSAACAAISGLVGVDRRLFALLWTLAERWGAFADDHVFLPLKLSHSDLAALVAARRQSVSTALSRLQRQGAIERAEGGWIIRGEPPKIGR